MASAHALEAACRLDDQDPTEMLQHVLVTVERAVRRLPLDDLLLPCPHCLQYVPLGGPDPTDSTPPATCSCQCQCPLPDTIVLKKDSSMQTSPMFEFAGAIPHIDSDEDDEKDLCRNTGVSSHPVQIQTPKSISDLPEKLLMSGVNLPGTSDRDGRPMVVCEALNVRRAALNWYELASLLLYYATIPSKERMKNGLRVLVLGEDAEEWMLHLLDKTVSLVAPHVVIHSVIVWRPGPTKPESRPLPTSNIPTVGVRSLSELEALVEVSAAPAACGGGCTHDQLEWVEFFRELEPFLAQCRAAARALLLALQDIREQDVPPHLLRRYLHHQHRQLSRAVCEPGVVALRAAGARTLASVCERAHWLRGGEDVRVRATHARHSYSVAERVARRLETLANERRAALEELARLRALEEEANKILSWLRNEGDTILQQYIEIQKKATSLEEIKLRDQEFERFYFGAMRQIDPVSELVEVSLHCQSNRSKSFKEVTSALKAQVATFSEQLEEVRQRLEDTARCFDLIQRSQQNIPEEVVRLATATQNEKLLEMCKDLSESVQEDASSEVVDQPIEGATSTPVKPAAGPHRRRSVSSFAFIYKCNHHAAGMPCECWDGEVDENSESAKLKKKYEQSLQQCGCLKSATGLDRKNSAGLDGIKEVRESTEDLLAASDKNDSGVSGCGRCDSAVSTATGSDAVFKRRLQRTGSCQFCAVDSYAQGSSGTSSSAGSHGDHSDHTPFHGLEEGDSFPKSTGSEEMEETDEQYNSDRSKTVPPIPVNSHLHCRASTLDLPNTHDQNLDPKTQKTLLLIMREMIQTERDYVKSLYYVIENYIPELLRSDIPQALRGQRNVVFGNIEKIYEFHSQQFLRELEMCENSPLHVGQIFLRHTNKFSLYALYNKNKPKSDSLMSEYGRTFFKTKQQHLNDNLDLASYLLKPVQRMGKYALLLQQLLKACPELGEGAPERAQAEREDLSAAEDMVRFQLRHGNDLLAMDSIRDCDVNLKEQGRLLRQNEFLVSEGRGGKKSFRQVFLFEELILFSKAKRFPDRKNLDLYIYKNSIKMTDIGLTAKIGDSPTKFEIWFRKRKPNDTFVLQAMSQDVKKAWTEELSKLLWKQAMKNREIRLAEMSSMGIGNKPCLDIRPSADQISDRSISIAQLSKTAPKFRNSLVGPPIEGCRNVARPHSIISMSSTSSGSTSSQGSRHQQPDSSVAATSASLHHHHHHRPHTLHSQCSMESGIIADISIGSDDCTELQMANFVCWPLQKSNSSSSGKLSTANAVVQTDESSTITLIHVQEDDPVNI